MHLLCKHTEPYFATAGFGIIYTVVRGLDKMQAIEPVWRRHCLPD
jgi:hypothetical protein